MLWYFWDFDRPSTYRCWHLATYVVNYNPMPGNATLQLSHKKNWCVTKPSQASRLLTLCRPSLQSLFFTQQSPISDPWFLPSINIQHIQRSLQNVCVYFLLGLKYETWRNTRFNSSARCIVVPSFCSLLPIRQSPVSRYAEPNRFNENYVVYWWRVECCTNHRVQRHADNVVPFFQPVDAFHSNSGCSEVFRAACTRSVVAKVLTHIRPWA